MRSNFRKLRHYIRQIDLRNTAGREGNLLGVSTRKVFIQSVANTVGTNFKRYKVVKRNQFTYVPDTSRRGDKIGLAMLTHLDEAIVSQAYTVFEVMDTDQLDPEYLMMWFRRPEFDRYARYMSHGSVREIFGWEEMCDVELPIPDITIQREIVRKYNMIIDRIEMNKKLCVNLEETAQALYKHWFVDFEFPVSVAYSLSVEMPEIAGSPYKTSGGEMKYCDELEHEIPKNWQAGKVSQFFDVKGGKRLPKGSSLTKRASDYPYIKVADLGQRKFVVLDEKFEYLNKEDQKKIARYIVTKGDLVLSIVGTIGESRIIDTSLDGANLTENCVKLLSRKKGYTDFLYHYLNSKDGKEQIEMKTVGAVQDKLPIYNIKEIRFVCPEPHHLERFEQMLEAINFKIRNSENEIVLLNKFRSILLSRISNHESVAA